MLPHIVFYKGAIIMVQLLIGHKGSGKTKKMVDMANESLDKVNGSVVLINKNHRVM